MRLHASSDEAREQIARYRHNGETVTVSTNDEACLLYTSDAADERSSVDLGGRRIIKKKKKTATGATTTSTKSIIR